ncbi:RNA polymerase sigma factor (sigma-70 family) [Dysgonomonas hofstadii]|uniref:RNA polymerase sigma factor (Sigma-70 family) n=1 Tax=Dysgonomonas hofstadii TaxID=637886 RepID=A0A840CYF6_9BACT|nr:sigma-70 family RNA polymerase sigma factor [Dysgonomonas hofstadii]MBB4036963.1 RNA polymerase sigma factor (sigma-70 family) [Dysgonomonas hofstadii]
MTKQTDKENLDNLDDLVKEYQPQLKSFIRRRVSNKEDAEDILQDVFYQLIKAADNAANPIEQVAAWLYRVARNTIINKARKRTEEEFPVSGYDDEGNILKDFSEILFNGDSPTPETEYLRSLVWQELESALAELPAEQKEIFELTEIEGLPVKEISEATGISVNTLLSRKHYAAKFLRKRLEGLYKDIIFY